MLAISRKNVETFSVRDQDKRNGISVSPRLNPRITMATIGSIAMIDGSVYAHETRLLSCKTLIGSAAQFQD